MVVRGIPAERISATYMTDDEKNIATKAAEQGVPSASAKAATKQSGLK